MNVNKSIKTIDKKMEPNKAQYNLGRKAAKILTLSSGKGGKYEFLTGEHILPQNRPLKRL